jgi:hypothetical protein
MFEKAKSIGFRRLRHVSGMVLLSSLILISAMDFVLHWNRHNVWQEIHSITIPELMEQRLARFREHLPAWGAVGYIGDEPRWDYASTFKVVTQYVLAPLFLKPYVRFCFSFDLPFAHHVRSFFSKMSPEKQRLIIYDQLNPACAKYYTRQEAYDLLAWAGFQVTLHHRLEFSWAVIGTK